MDTDGRLARRTGHYAIASVTGVLLGLVSYPLFTRTLSVEEYGTMGLVQVLLLVAAGVAKLGLQNSIVRLWPAYETDPRRQSTFISTFLAAALTLGLGVGVVGLAVDLALHATLPARLGWSIAAALLLVPTRTLYSLAENLLRARERSRAFTFVSAGNGILSLAGAAVLVVLVAPPGWRVPAFYAGLALGEGLVVVLALRAAIRGTAVFARSFDRALVTEGLAFGAPLVLFELATVTLLFGNRLVLEIFRGPWELGLYTAAYSLAWQVASLFARPIEMAAMPMVARLFEREGPGPARALVERLVRLYYLAAIPIVAGMWAVRGDLTVVLASRKFQAAQGLVPLLTAGFLIFGARVYLGAGLYLHKRSRTSGGIALGGAVLNVLVNLALVPRFGAMGSAAGTAFTLLVVVVALAVAGRQTFPFDLGLRRIPVYLAGAGLMVAAVLAVRLAPLLGDGALVPVAQLGARIVVGVVAYGAFALVVEPEARTRVGRLLRRAPAPAAASRLAERRVSRAKA
jgi:O-antigen/teichoic acid export membrane protein